MLTGHLQPDGAIDATRWVSSRAGRKPVLAGPLCRAQRELRPAAAGRAVADARQRRVSGGAVAPGGHRVATAGAAAGPSRERQRPASADAAAARSVDDRPAAAHDLEQALIAGLFDRRGCHSLAFNIEQTVRVGGTVRDRLSSDNWRVLNQLFQSVRTPAGREGLADVAGAARSTRSCRSSRSAASRWRT